MNPGSLPTAAQCQSAQRENPVVGEDDVHEVARLIPPRQRQCLIDGEIDFVKKKAAERIRDQWHESPGGVVSPIDLRCQVVAADDGPNEARLAEL